MHIIEGYLPPIWCLIWFVIAIPVVYIGARKVIKIFRESPDQKITVALSGAFIFMLSSLKMPSVTGSSSHPTGTGLSVALYGVAITSFLATIVLIFQAILLAHGGLTTLGANIVSMGIAGPALGFLIWRTLRRMKLSIALSMFVTAFIADLSTYIVTALQLTLAHGSANYMTAFAEFMATFALTQVPIAIIEGIVFAIFADYLSRVRPHLFNIDDEIEPDYDCEAV
ncbi:MAG: energy-coupling factor ABC transporter permease [Candidatus Methanoplasma sp.]|jgi:cobalt/nickel transport system permease protein|nr:energy-coupling factor ABC transporter permease [Candidatus Methanoplasma sp.]